MARAHSSQLVFCVVVLCALAAPYCVNATMGPLLPDVTDLDRGSGGCVSNPGDRTAACADMGVYASATACAAACEAALPCSAVTYHGPSTGEWASHCVWRLDNLWLPRACGAGCDHTSSNKTSGWVPGPLPPPPPPPPSPNTVWLPSSLPWGKPKVRCRYAQSSPFSRPWPPQIGGGTSSYPPSHTHISSTPLGILVWRQRVGS